MVKYWFEKFFHNLKILSRALFSNKIKIVIELVISSCWSLFKTNIIYSCTYIRAISLTIDYRHTTKFCNVFSWFYLHSRRNSSTFFRLTNCSVQIQTLLFFRRSANKKKPELILFRCLSLTLIYLGTNARLIFKWNRFSM